MWSLPRPSCCCVRRRRVTAARRTQKTVSVQSCWSTLAHAMRTGYFFTAGWRRANAVSLSVSKKVVASYKVTLINLNVCLCVQSPNVPSGCSTVNAPSPAPQPAIVSTSRRSARKSVWMAAHALVTSHSLYLPLPLSITLLVLVVTCICFSVGKVLDGNRCVEVSQCSCVHMGRHFPPGSTISQDCNTW